MLRLFSILALLFICQACCKQRICRGDGLPVIAVKLTSIPQNDDTFTFSIIENGQETTVPILFTDPNDRVFTFSPMNDYDDAAVGSRQFVFRHNNRSDTIRRVIVLFMDSEVDCDGGWGCGRGNGKEKVIVKKLLHFSFFSNGKPHGVRDTVFLD